MSPTPASLYATVSGIAPVYTEADCPDLRPVPGVGGVVRWAVWTVNAGRVAIADVERTDVEQPVATTINVARRAFMAVRRP